MSMERIAETEATQSNMTVEKLASKRIKLENLKQRIDRQKRVIAEQKVTKEALDNEFDELEKASADLTQTLKLNDKLIAGVQTRVYESIRKKVKARIDTSIANRDFEFVNNLVVTVDGQDK